jgi:hypothetical protein
MNWSWSEVSSPYIHRHRKSLLTEPAARLIPGAAFTGGQKARHAPADDAAFWLFGALSPARWAGNHQRVLTARRTRNVLIVGASGLGRRIATYLETHSEIERVFCGFLDDRRPLGKEIVGRTIQLAQLARMGFVDEVILA